MLDRFVQMLMKRTRKQVDITLYRKSLLYDTSNTAYIIADSIPDLDDKVRSAITDICEGGNVDRVTRVINRAFNDLLNLLFAYTKDRVVEENKVDDLFSEPEVYKIRMMVPRDFSKTTVSALGEYLHDYIVNLVIVDWLSITKKDEAAIWQDKADTIFGKVRSIMNDRVGAIKRKMSTF